MVSRYKIRSEKGFTLIEVLLVVALLGLLAAIAIPNLIFFVGEGQLESANTEAATVRVALTGYAFDLAVHEDDDDPLNSIHGSVGQAGSVIPAGSLNTVLGKYFLTDLLELQALYGIVSGRITTAVPDPDGEWAGLTWINGRWQK